MEDISDDEVVEWCALLHPTSCSPCASCCCVHLAEHQGRSQVKRLCLIKQKITASSPPSSRNRFLAWFLKPRSVFRLTDDGVSPESATRTDLRVDTRRFEIADLETVAGGLSLGSNGTGGSTPNSLPPDAQRASKSHGSLPSHEDSSTKARRTRVENGAESRQAPSCERGDP